MDTPAASLSLSDRIQWIHHTVGKEIIDATIVPTNANDLCENLSLKVMVRPLQADDISYRHDRSLLSQAIDDLLGEL